MGSNGRNTCCIVTGRQPLRPVFQACSSGTTSNSKLNRKQYRTGASWTAPSNTATRSKYRCKTACSWTTKTSIPPTSGSPFKPSHAYRWIRGSRHCKSPDRNMRQQLCLHATLCHLQVPCVAVLAWNLLHGGSGCPNQNTQLATVTDPDKRRLQMQCLLACLVICQGRQHMFFFSLKSRDMPTDHGGQHIVDSRESRRKSQAHAGSKTSQVLDIQP